MTRYELRNPRGERYPGSPTFLTATLAVEWATLMLVPVDYWPWPVKEVAP